MDALDWSLSIFWLFSNGHLFWGVEKTFHKLPFLGTGHDNPKGRCVLPIAHPFPLQVKMTVFQPIRFKAFHLLKTMKVTPNVFCFSSVVNAVGKDTPGIFFCLGGKNSKC